METLDALARQYLVRQPRLAVSDDRYRSAVERHLPPAGRRVTVQTASDDGNVIVPVPGRQNAAWLLSPDPNAPSHPDGRIEWRPSFPDPRVPVGVLGRPWGAPLDGVMCAKRHGSQPRPVSPERSPLEARAH
jgi:hypothetical protein